MLCRPSPRSWDEAYALAERLPDTLTPRAVLDLLKCLFEK